LKDRGQAMSWAQSDDEFRAQIAAYNREQQQRPNDNKTIMRGKLSVIDGDSGEEHVAPLEWVDMSAWDSVPVPVRQWAIKDRVPLKQAGLFSGEGGTGKSILELTKDVAHVTAKDWLGTTPEHGPAIYVGAEDDQDEIHIRLASIANHYQVTFEELINGG